MVIVGFVLVLGFGAVITNLVRLQLVNGETLKTDAVDQSLQSTQLTPSRGTIYDATGTKVLAQSASVWTVALEPNYIDEGDDVKIAKGLSEILGLDYDAVLKKAQQNSYFVYVKRKVETEVRDEIVQYIKDEKIGRGITLMEDYKRYYPYGTTASTVLGFTGTDNQGLAGVETEYDSELTGTAGRLVSAKNAQGDDMPFQYDQYVQAQDGYDLVLTIDETVQSIVEKHLQAGLEACGALEGGTAVLMNVKTGAILALSTKGDYDPNDPFTISQEAEDAIPEKVEDALQKAQEKEQQELNTLQLAIDNAETDEARAEAKKALSEYERIDVTTLRDELTDQMWGEAQNKQWRNKAVSETYYPGSVFKMVTGSMAMESGVASEDSTYTCVGYWDFNDPTIKPMYCWYHSGHGTETLVDGICNSCNPYMIWLGQKMGRHTFFNFFEAFGFTQRTGIDLPGEASGVFHTRERLANTASYGTSYLIATSFGQTIKPTPIQLVTAISAVVNGGYLLEPYVVSEIVDSEGNVVQQNARTVVRQVISEDTSKTVREIMEYEVEHGTGKNGKVAGYRIGGKTGTADQIDGSVTVSFTCCAPADDPQIMMLLTLSNASDKTGTYRSGGNMAAPVASSIMAEILPYLGIEPTYSADELVGADHTVPNVVGLKRDEAAAKLKEEGFSCRTVGDGETVTDQTPLGGAIVPNNAEIILYLGAEKSTELCIVPNVVGDSAAAANRKLTDAGLIMSVSGATGGSSASVRAISQSETPGTEVAAGTVVRVQFSDSSVTD